MKKRIFYHFLVIISALLIDVIYLTSMSGFYNAQLIAFDRTIRVIPALMVWTLIPLGIIIFVLPKANSAKHAMLLGAAYGFILYAVYDLTNYAILADYPLLITIVDIIWGTLLCSVVSLIGHLLREKN